MQDVLLFPGWFERFKTSYVPSTCNQVADSLARYARIEVYAIILYYVFVCQSDKGSTYLPYPISLPKTGSSIACFSKICEGTPCNSQ